MNDFVKNVLKLFQIICIIMIPIALVNFYFPKVTLFDFAAPLNKVALDFFSNFISMTINGVDWSMLFIILPWVFYIIGSGIIVNFLDKLQVTVEEKAKEIKLEHTVQKIKAQEVSQKDKLQNKNMVYVTIAVIFSKFTISNLSDREIEEKRADVKKDLLKDLGSYRGKVVEDEAFDDDDTFALLFMNQEDALNFIIRYKELVAYYDNETQNYGYSISFKAILDAQDSSATPFYVFQFTEKALRAIEAGEICATKDFATRYNQFGKMKQLNFVSKGNYIINKARVELTRLEYN